MIYRHFAMAEMLTATITKWDHIKQYGFLRVGSQNIFLHIKDFSTMHKQPQTGDIIRFSLGADAVGRACAVNAVHVRSNLRQPFSRPLPGANHRQNPTPPISTSKYNGLHADDIVLVVVLLIAPAFALHKLAFHPGVTVVSAMALSAVTFLTYVLDKTRAQSRDWRIPEVTLHFLSFIGGWPGAFLGQQHVRHKTAKTSFQIVFWLTVFAWQFLALDYLLNWKISRFAWDTVLRWIN